EVWQRLEALADARRWENVSTAKVVEAAVAELVSVTRERRRLIAAFLVSAIQDPAIREGGLRFRRRVEERIRALLLPRRSEIDNVFDWQYALRKQNLLNLYEKGKTLAWNANDLDWSTDVDIERLVRQRIANGLAPMINSMLSPPVELGDDEVIRMQLHLNAFM